MDLEAKKRMGNGGVEQNHRRLHRRRDRMGDVMMSKITIFTSSTKGQCKERIYLALCDAGACS